MEKVTFYVSTGMVGSNREETFELVDLGIDSEEYKTEDELEKAIGEVFEEWVWENINASWNLEE